MIAAGINSKALSTYMGHSTITITLDRYGHLLPGNETQAANLLETWLTHAATDRPSGVSTLAQATVSSWMSSSGLARQLRRLRFGPDSQAARGRLCKRSMTRSLLVGAKRGWP